MILPLSLANYSFFTDSSIEKNEAFLKIKLIVLKLRGFSKNKQWFFKKYVEMFFKEIKDNKFYETCKK